MNRRKDRAQAGVSATELAQMGTCERMVWLEHRFGRRRTAKQEAATQRGLAEHARFFDESKRLMNGDTRRTRGRCFVATLLLAESAQAAPHLAMLREYRDHVMKPSELGRLLVMGYYQTGPMLCRILTRNAWLRRPARAIVIALAVLAAASLNRRRNGRRSTVMETRDDAGGR